MRPVCPDVHITLDSCVQCMCTCSPVLLKLLHMDPMPDMLFVFAQVLANTANYISNFVCVRGSVIFVQNILQLLTTGWITRHEQKKTDANHNGPINRPSAVL